MTSKKKSTAENAVADATARLNQAKTEHAAALIRSSELRTEGQRIADALATGQPVTEEEMILNRTRLDAAATIAESRRRGVVELEKKLADAQAGLVAHQIRTDAGGYVSWERLNADVLAATADFIATLDTLADRAGERSAFLAQSMATMRGIDGGRYAGSDHEIGGVRRVQSGHSMFLELDGDRLYDMPATAVFDTAADEVNMAGLPTVRYARQRGQLEVVPRVSTE